jgi:Domain of unknown function (DUF4214)
VMETANALSIKRLYLATLGRGPDDAGWAGWTANLDGGQSLNSIAGGFVGSSEFQTTYGALNNTQFVTLLYNNVLKRAPDTGGLNGWLNLMNNGTTRPEVVTGFSQSGEFQTASDGILQTGQIYRLYGATLARQPDAGGLLGWGTNMGNGQSIDSVAGGFVNSLEFQNTYGLSLTNTQFVTLLYQNVLGRAPDAPGLQGWLDSLAAGGTRTSVVLGFSNSGEYVNSTNPALISYMRTVTPTRNDSLEGGTGNDLMSGGEGADTFIFRNGQGGSDVIHRFESWDTLQFIDFGYANVAAAQAFLTQNGADVVFNNQGETITFVNTSLVSVQQAQWLLT